MKKHLSFTGKALALFLTLITVFLAISPVSQAAEVPMTEKAAHILLYCFNTDSVLYEKNADIPVDPGYTAQLMTALLAFEHYPDLNTQVTLESDLVSTWYFPNDFRPHTDYGFEVGATLPVKDLIVALMLENTTSAASLLAGLIGTAQEDFVSMMNARAASLSMSETVFVNATGVKNSASRSTARDLLLLAKYLYEIPAFMNLASTTSYTLSNGFTVYTRNYFLGSWYTSEHLNKNINGMKTDSVSVRQTTAIIATSVEKNGYSYLAIVLGGVGDMFGNYATYDLTSSLLTWGSDNFHYLKVLTNAELLGSLPVKNGDAVKSVPLFPEKDVTVFLSKDVEKADLVYRTTLTEEYLTAPFEKGTVVGEVLIYHQEELIGSCKLVTGQDVTKSKNAVFREFLARFFKNPIVIVAIFFLCLLVARRILILIHRRKKAKRAAESMTQP